MHYSYFGPLLKQGIYTLQLLLGATLKERYFTHYSCKGGPRQVLRLPFLKHTTAYNHDNDLI